MPRFGLNCITFIAALTLNALCWARVRTFGCFMLRGSAHGKQHNHTWTEKGRTRSYGKRIYRGEAQCSHGHGVRRRCSWHTSLRHVHEQHAPPCSHAQYDPFLWKLISYLPCLRCESINYLHSLSTLGFLDHKGYQHLPDAQGSLPPTQANALWDWHAGVSDCSKTQRHTCSPACLEDWSHWYSHQLAFPVFAISTQEWWEVVVISTTNHRNEVKVKVVLTHLVFNINESRIRNCLRIDLQSLFFCEFL